MPDNKFKIPFSGGETIDEDVPVVQHNTPVPNPASDLLLKSAGITTPPPVANTDLIHNFKPLPQRTDLVDVMPDANAIDAERKRQAAEARHAIEESDRQRFAQYAKVQVATLKKIKQGNDAIDAQALKEVQENNPYAPPEALAGQAEERAQQIKDNIKKKQDDEAKAWDDKTFASLTGLGQYGDNTLKLRQQHDEDNPTIPNPLTQKSNMDMSWLTDGNGNINPDIKKEVIARSGNNPLKFKQVLDSIVDYHIGQQQAAPTIMKDMTQKAQDYLHDANIGGVHVLRPVAYATQAVSAGAKAAFKTGTTLGMAMLAPFHTEGTASDDAFYQRYGDAINNINQISDQPTETSGNVDNILGGASRMAGEIEALAPFGRVAGEVGARTIGNRWMNGITQGLEKVGANRTTAYLDNVLATGRMFAPNMYANYFDEALQQGYTPDQARGQALQKTAVSIPAMALTTFAGKTHQQTMRSVADEILQGAGKEAPAGYVRGLQKLIKTIRPSDAAMGGVGMGLSSFGDAYLDHQNAIDAGHIDPNTPFNMTDAIDKSVSAAAMGAVTTGILHLTQGHGNLVGQPQANAIYRAAQDPQSFKLAIQREVSKGTMTPEDASKVTGYVDMITVPEKEGGQSLLQQGFAKLGKDATPDKAVQWATEQARLNEVVQKHRELAEQTKPVTYTNKQGNPTTILYAKDANGNYTEAAGRAMAPELNDLERRQYLSEKSLRQLEEGSYMKGRTVSGDELLRLTSANTPETRLSTDQVKSILSQGPYTTSEVKASDFREDPKIKEYVRQLKEQRNNPDEKVKPEEGQTDEILNFSPTKAHDPIVTSDGEVIDGRKRIAYAIANGEKSIQVVQPVEQHKIAEQAEEVRQDAIGVPEMDIKGLPAEQIPVLQNVQDAYEKGVDREPTDQDKTKGASTQAMRGLFDAAETAKDAKLSKGEAIDFLQRATGGETAPAAAEHVANVVYGGKEAKPVDIEAPALVTEVPRETWQQDLATHSSEIKDSPLWDKETNSLKPDVTEEEAHDFLLDGSTPDRFNTIEPEHPEIESEKESLKTLTDEPTIQAFDKRTTDEVEKSEPVVADIESKAESTDETELNQAVESADRAIADITGDQTSTDANTSANEQPARSGGDASEQASVIKRGRTNILVDSDKLRKIGWSKKSIEAFNTRLQAMFGRSSFEGKGVGVAVVDQAFTEKETKRRGDNAPDAWYKDGVVYINADHPSLKPSSLLHESGHLWKDWAKVNAPELHAKGLELAQQTPEFKYATAKIADSKSKETFGLSADQQKYWDKYAKAYKSHADTGDSIADEVLAHSIQSEGKNLAPGDTRSQFMKWLQNFWTAVKSSAGFDKMTTVKFANLSLKDFSKAVAEELGSGRALTKAIIEEQKTGKEKSAKTSSVDEVQDAILEDQAASRRKAAPEGTEVIDTGSTKSGAAADVETTDDVVRAMSSIGASGILDMAAKDAAKFQSALEAVSLTPEYIKEHGEEFNSDAARSILADVIARPFEASSVAKTRLGIRTEGNKVKLTAKGIARELFDGIADRINTQGGEKLDARLTGEKIADALAKNVQLQEKADTEHVEAKKRGAENQRKSVAAGAKSKAENTVIDEIAKRMTEGGDTSTRALKKLATENGLSESDAERLAEQASEKMLGDAKFSLGGQAENEDIDRKAVYDAIQETAKEEDINAFADQAKDILRKAYGAGFIAKSEAGKLVYAAETARTPERKAAFLKAIESLDTPEAKAEPVKPITETPVEPTPGTANLSEDDLTGVKHAKTASERAKMQLGKFEKSQSRSWGEDWDKAAGLSDTYVGLLIKEGQTGQKQYSSTDYAAMLRQQIKLKQQQAALYDAMDKAEASGDDAAKSKAYYELGYVNNNLQDLFTALEKGGSESGRALAARKMLATMDYELSNMLAQKRAANMGRELSEGEQQQVRDLNKTIEDLQKKVDTLEKSAQKKVRKAKVESDVETQIDVIKNRPRSKQSDPKAAEKSILDRISARLGLKGEKYSLPDGEQTMFSLPDGGEMKFSIPEDQLHELKGDITDLVTLYIGEGETDHEVIMDKVQAALGTILPDITREEIGIAFSGYGKTSFPSEDAVKKQLAEMRTAERLIQAELDVRKGESPKKTGFQRGKPSDANRERQRNLKALMDEHNIQVTDPKEQLATRLEAAKTAMRNRIADVNKAILSGERIVKTGKPLELDTEGIALKAERDRLQGEYEKTFGKAELTDEQRVSMATKSLERSIAEYERRISENDLKPTKGESKTPETPELLDLRAKRDQLKKAADDLYREANPGKSDAELATEAAIRSAEKSIKDIEERLRTGQLDGTKPESKVVETPELLAARAKRDALKEELKKAKLEANPPKDPYQAALDRLKKSVEKRKAELQRRIDEKDYSKPVKKVTEPDRELEVARLDLKRKQNEFKRDVEEDRKKNRNWFEKSADWWEAFQRSNKLSGLLTLGKLASAGIERALIAHGEEAIGGALSKVPLLRDIAAKAPREGYLNSEAEANAMFKGMLRSYGELGRIIRTGHSAIDEKYDEKHGHEKSSGVLHLFGNIHAGLKNPAKQAEFQRSFTKRLAAAGRAGLDMTDPLVVNRVTAEAYKDSKRAIFLNDNWLSDKFTELVEGAKKPDSKGNISPAKRLGALLVRTLVPFVKVPTNVVKETLVYSGGSLLGLAEGGAHYIKAVANSRDLPVAQRFAQGWSKAIENMAPDEADAILRHLKKGSIGLALMLTGYFAPQTFGGYGKKKEEGDLNEGEVELGGYKLPKWMVHNPLLETLQIGATIRKTVDNLDTHPDAGTLDYLWPALTGISEEVPFLTSTKRLGRAFESPSSFGSFLQDQVVSSALPTLTKDASKALDLKEPPHDWNTIMGAEANKRSPQKKGINSWLDRIRLYGFRRKDVADSPEEAKSRDANEN